ncbi:hypothetical protein KVR01_004082 [Diaporthe batatas]|uniref:uncharacterized protein n=1 Tax=Diaporthe batatas TaxID=748121 RepID=UPI001D03C0AA|nr:uncharacterized protein KVR01_004082 [Diaporthe batatas]KAG8165530.1 hypothetical protein KVR01_004082 [Diaporthe batatas]
MSPCRRRLASHRPLDDDFSHGFSAHPCMIHEQPVSGQPQRRSLPITTSATRPFRRLNKHSNTALHSNRSTPTHPRTHTSCPSHKPEPQAGATVSFWLLPSCWSCSALLLCSALLYEAAKLASKHSPEPTNRLADQADWSVISSRRKDSLCSASAWQACAR